MRPATTLKVYSGMEGIFGLLTEVTGSDATNACTLKGKVTDANTGARLFGAIVELVNSGRTYITSPTGYFKFDGLSEGILLVEVTVPGYRPIQTVIALTENGTVDLDISLQLELA